MHISNLFCLRRALTCVEVIVRCKLLSNHNCKANSDHLRMNPISVPFTSSTHSRTETLSLALEIPLALSCKLDISTQPFTDFHCVIVIFTLMAFFKSHSNLLLFVLLRLFCIVYTQQGAVCSRLQECKSGCCSNSG